MKFMRQAIAKDMKSIDAAMDTMPELKACKSSKCAPPGSDETSGSVDLMMNNENLHKSNIKDMKSPKKKVCSTKSCVMKKALKLSKKSNKNK